MLSQVVAPHLFHIPSNHSLLLIDDDPDQRFVISALLRRAGYRVHCTESGYEGMLELSRRAFDLVLCDLRMPDMTGFEFVQTARGTPTILRFSRLPIILLTACSRDLEFAALEIGADMFCEKKQVHTLLLSQIEFLLS